MSRKSRRATAQEEAPVVVVRTLNNTERVFLLRRRLEQEGVPKLEALKQAYEAVFKEPFPSRTPEARAAPQVHGT